MGRGRAMEIEVREVWDSNLRQEMNIIASIKDSFPYVAFDTEFPGFVVPSPREATNDELYAVMKANVEGLKLLQVGLAFFDQESNIPCLKPNCGCVWQFNLCDFDASSDRHSPSAIKFLKKNGIDFEAIRNRGIDSKRLRDEFWAAGLVGNPQLWWLCFHGTYDFAYMLKLVYGGKPLPCTRPEFMQKVNRCFCNLYDLKYMAKFYSELKRGNLGLQKMAEILGVKEQLELSKDPAGEMGNRTFHQAGWDSLVTGLSFLTLKKVGESEVEKKSIAESQTDHLDWADVVRYSYGVVFEMDDVCEQRQMMIRSLIRQRMCLSPGGYIVFAPHMALHHYTYACGVV